MKTFSLLNVNVWCTHLSCFSTLLRTDSRILCIEFFGTFDFLLASFLDIWPQTKASIRLKPITVATLYFSALFWADSSFLLPLLSNPNRSKVVIRSSEFAARTGCSTSMVDNESAIAICKSLGSTSMSAEVLQASVMSFCVFLLVAVFFFARFGGGFCAFKTFECELFKLGDWKSSEESSNRNCLVVEDEEEEGGSTLFISAKYLDSVVRSLQEKREQRDVKNNVYYKNYFYSLLHLKGWLIKGARNHWEKQ